jgi:hypothetical protein
MPLPAAAKAHSLRGTISIVVRVLSRRHFDARRRSASSKSPPRINILSRKGVAEILVPVVHESRERAAFVNSDCGAGLARLRAFEEQSEYG